MFLRRIEYEKEKITNPNIYPYNIPCLQTLEMIEFNHPVTFLIGENGSGKSTLIEALALKLGLNGEGGTNNFRFCTKNTISNLSQYLKIVKHTKLPQTKFFLRAESFYNFATKIDEIQEESGGIIEHYGGKSLHEQSHGESFISVIKNRFGENGLYILDEPEAALSPTRQMSLLILMDELIHKGSQFIIVTHSPILLSFPNAEILDLDNGFSPKKYETTEIYQLYKLFINDKERILKELLHERNNRTSI